MKQVLKNISCVGLLVFAVVALFVSIQTRHIWGEVYVEQILSNLTEGVTSVSNKVIWGYLISILLGVVSAVSFSIILKRNKQLLIASGVCFLIVFHQIGFFSYLFNKTVYSKIYEKEYAFPQNLHYNFLNEKRNLIVIYLESIDADYATSPYLKENLIPNIYAQEKTALSFEGFYQLKHQDYTMAAMIASMCAVPYKKSLLGGHVGYQNFLTELVCYPSVLAQHGYQTVFMKGADINFARTGLFMSTHGFETVMGKNELEKKFKLPLKENMGGFSGYHDAALYEMVKLELQELSASDKPFALFFLTLDTHGPDYFLSPKCKGEPTDKKDVVKCADSMLADFLRWLEIQDFYENTTVVVLADHPETGINKIYPKQKNRRIINFILNPSGAFSKQPHSAWTTLDVAPTVLNALGIGFEKGQFGLGRSLLQKNPTLLETKGMKLETELSKSSKVYNSFEAVKIKTEPSYKLYAPFSIKVSDIEQIKDYATYALVSFNTVYTDELSFTLPDVETDSIKLYVTFKMMLTKETKNRIKVYANGVLVDKWNVSQKDSQPVSRKAVIPTKLIKENKLRITFEDMGADNQSEIIGLGIVSFTLQMF